MKIGDREFKYKKDALSHFKDILNSYEVNHIVNESDFNDLLALIHIRPDKDSKIGSGIASFRITNVRYNTKCFELVRTDGTSEVFSYLKCINGKSKPFTQFSKTCRETVNNDLRSIKLQYFKKHSSNGKVKCQETGELCKWEELNVDHRQPNTFSVIVDRFIEVEKINLEKIEYEEIVDGVYSFADKKMAENFREYHKEKANLRLVKKGKNLGRSHQARVNRQKKDLKIE